ncbi:hypothetical protein GTQ34_14635 [Muricauda sp. JGD-17]|uniref:Uncharacterized protein n=1 Tax=Flagellimonas ochracea TaxID=2696472 RepID=A0A964TF13_9FLAO|nr:DUF6452 family protein [Allomuricauda ochracea]NAY93149.1 hypothetical protein [Allomuricauda ochracea]
MRKILPALLITILLVHISSCEKDDICVDGDTPLVVIGFFDVADTAETKQVTSLRIINTDISTVLDNESFGDRSNSPDSLSVPLRINEVTTSYQFILDSADDEDTEEETGNVDTLTISYQVRESFVSRACGFVANFNDLTVTLSEGTENWIQDIQIVQSTVENSNNIHVKIFH